MSTSAYRPRFGYDIRIHPERPRRPTVSKRCAMPGCASGAEVYVPKTRYDMNDRQWLCREHLREHNRGWNYFAGMSDQEIERFCLDSVTGHRPTCRLANEPPLNRATTSAPVPTGATASRTALPCSRRPPKRPRRGPAPA